MIFLLLALERSDLFFPYALSLWYACLPCLQVSDRSSAQDVSCRCHRHLRVRRAAHLPQAHWRSARHCWLRGISVRSRQAEVANQAICCSGCSSFTFSLYLCLVCFLLPPSVLVISFSCLSFLSSPHSFHFLHFVSFCLRRSLREWTPPIATPSIPRALPHPHSVVHLPPLPTRIPSRWLRRRVGHGPGRG